MLLIQEKKDSSYNTCFIFVGFIAKRGWIFVVSGFLVISQ